MLEWREFDELLLSHPLVPSGPLPTAEDSDGVYPYESFCETARRPTLRRYRMISVENDFLKVVICPDLGGRVQSLVLKASGTESLYVSPVVRPVRILPRQSFIGGGIESSFPISHTPVQIEPVVSKIAEVNGRIYVWCGEREVRFGMHWTVEFSLGQDDVFLTHRSVFSNPGSAAHPWMSWANAGVPARPDTELHFPSGPVLRHDDAIRVIDWQTEGPRFQGAIERMTGFFWQEADCCAFGVFTPSLGSGLYHVADPESCPGIKLWSDGNGVDEAWVDQWTLNREQCLEIQAGPLVDQSIKVLLEPGATHSHVGYWFPTDRPMEIRSLGLPNPDLVPMDQVPRFSWARPEQVERWQTLISAHRNQNPTAIPHPPSLVENDWPPSGMDDLGAALSWASQLGDTDRDWLACLGIWQAGRNQISEALENLVASGNDRALALAGRLFRRCRGDAHRSADCFRGMRCEAFALHPQITVERDMTLAQIGDSALDERDFWLRKSSALDDEWLIERRATLLLDQGRPDAARSLLESTKFQLIHQRYTRTRLWKRILAASGDSSPTRVPRHLGEDDLAEFGAYREHQEEAD